MAHTFVKDIMKKDIVTINSTKSIIDAASIMDKKNVGCVIITKNEKPVGILTERDFVKIVAKNKGLSLSLFEEMSSPLITIGPEETVWEAAELMKTKNIHKLVVQDNGNVLGIITTSDLVAICSVGSDSEMRRICDEILMRMQSK